MAAWLCLSSACAQTPVVRVGPDQQRIVTATFEVTPADARSAILAALERPGPSVRQPFQQMRATPITAFQPDWLLGYVDPGGFLDPYRQLPPGERAMDIALLDAIGDLYWTSEYRVAGADGAPVQFRSGFVIHLASRGPARTDVQIFEITPTVWVGGRWGWSMHGIGFGRQRDIRVVEPTVTDRVNALSLVGQIIADRQGTAR